MSMKPGRNVLAKSCLPAALPLCLLVACSAPAPRDALQGHLHEMQQPASPAGDIPAPVHHTLAPPLAPPTPKLETYSVVVHDVPVRDLLFVLARDARLNIDIHPGLQGPVSLNAIDQTLPQILSRISRHPLFWPAIRAVEPLLS